MLGKLGVSFDPFHSGYMYLQTGSLAYNEDPTILFTVEKSIILELSCLSEVKCLFTSYRRQSTEESFVARQHIHTEPLPGYQSCTVQREWLVEGVSRESYL